ncbi:hypothetical protein IT408_03475 [Candidatus Uhrbacteria bacterium]|nr:hypothetical protein [Candidatus Uhrbacteria bacterium]
MHPSEKRSFVLPEDKKPRPAMEGRSTGQDGQSSDSIFHEIGMGTTEEIETEDLSSLLEFTKQGKT